MWVQGLGMDVFSETVDNGSPALYFVSVYKTLHHQEGDYHLLTLHDAYSNVYVQQQFYIVDILLDETS